MLWALPQVPPAAHPCSGGTRRAPGDADGHCLPARPAHPLVGEFGWNPGQFWLWVLGALDEVPTQCQSCHVLTQAFQTAGQAWAHASLLSLRLFRALRAGTGKEQKQDSLPCYCSHGRRVNTHLALCNHTFACIIICYQFYSSYFKHYYPNRLGTSFLYLFRHK